MDQKQVPKSDSKSLPEQHRRGHSQPLGNSIVAISYNSSQLSVEQSSLEQISKLLVEVRQKKTTLIAVTQAITDYTKVLIFGDSLLKLALLLIDHIKEVTTESSINDLQQLTALLSRSFGRIWFCSRNKFSEIYDQLKNAHKLYLDKKDKPLDLFGKSPIEYWNEIIKKINGLRETCLVKEREKKNIIESCNSYSTQQYSRRSFSVHQNLSSDVASIKNIAENNKKIIYYNLSKVIDIFKDQPEVAYKIANKFCLLQQIQFHYQKERSFVIFFMIQDLAAKFAVDITPQNSIDFNELRKALASKFYYFFFSSIPSIYLSEPHLAKLQKIKFNYLKELGLQVSRDDTSGQYKVSKVSVVKVAKQSDLSLEKSDATLNLAMENWSQGSMDLLSEKLNQLQKVEAIFAQEDPSVKMQYAAFIEVVGIHSTSEVGEETNQHYVDSLLDSSTLGFSVAAVPHEKKDENSPKVINSGVSNNSLEEKRAPLKIDVTETMVAVIPPPGSPALARKRGSFFSDDINEDVIISEISTQLSQCETQQELLAVSTLISGKKLITYSSRLLLSKKIIEFIVEFSKKQKLTNVQESNRLFDILDNLLKEDRHWLVKVRPKEILSIKENIKAVREGKRESPLPQLQQVAAAVDSIITFRYNKLTEAQRAIVQEGLEKRCQKYAEAKNDGVQQFLSKMRATNSFSYGELKKIYDIFDQDKTIASRSIEDLAILQKIEIEQGPLYRERNLFVDWIIRLFHEKTKTEWFGSNNNYQMRLVYNSERLYLIFSLLYLGEYLDDGYGLEVNDYIRILLEKYFNMQIVYNKLTRSYTLSDESYNMKVSDGTADWLIAAINKVHKIDRFILARSLKVPQKYQSVIESIIGVNNSIGFDIESAPQLPSKCSIS